MKALLVYAHPEPQSFNGSLRTVAENTLQEQGYEVQVSDLYAMQFNPVAGPADVTARSNPDVFNLGLEQMHAVQNDALASDVPIPRIPSGRASVATSKSLGSSPSSSSRTHPPARYATKYGTCSEAKQTG